MLIIKTLLSCQYSNTKNILLRINSALQIFPVHVRPTKKVNEAEKDIRQDDFFVLLTCKHGWSQSICPTYLYIET
jgi:hypothetical protein